MITPQIIKRVQNVIKDVPSDTIISGGHFILKGGIPELNDGTIQSFKFAVNLYAHAKKQNIRVGLGILINDIGMTCDTNICYVFNTLDRKTFTLPVEYIKILHDAGIDVKELDIYWEKHLRNKSHAQFKRSVKKDKHNIKKKDGDYWLELENREQLLLTRNKVGTPYGIPACPLIMAGYLMEEEKREWNSSINFYYVDTDNYENVPNHFMIEKGTNVARYLGVNISVQNIYFTHDKIITNF